MRTAAVLFRTSAVAIFIESIRTTCASTDPPAVFSITRPGRKSAGNKARSRTSSSDKIVWEAPVSTIKFAVRVPFNSTGTTYNWPIRRTGITMPASVLVASGSGGINGFMRSTPRC